MNQDELEATLIVDLYDSLGGKTVTSVSGGKSSAYMAVHYPTDYYVFALVLTRDPTCSVKDKGLLREILNKCPCFEGSRELDQTIRNVLDLEQLIGSEIVWVYGDTFDKVIEDKSFFLPNARTRYCTSMMKVLPIWHWCYSNILNPVLDENGELLSVDPCKMQLGFRFDERRRVYKSLGATPTHLSGHDWSKAGACELMNVVSLKCDIAGKFAGKHRRLKTVEWRYQLFPLWYDYITQSDVIKYWDSLGWEFPQVSNCDYCFFHTKAQHLIQHQIHPERSRWWMGLEEDTGRTFKSDVSLRSLLYEDVNTSQHEEVDSCFCSD